MSIVITYPYPLGKRITEEKLIRCGREKFLEKGYAEANERQIMEYICAHRQECELALEFCYEKQGGLLYPPKFPPESDGLLQIRFIFEQFHLFRHFDCKIHIPVCSRSGNPVGSYHILFSGMRRFDPL